MSSDESTDPSTALVSLELMHLAAALQEALSAGSKGGDNVHALFTFAANGQLDKLREHLKREPDLVNSKNEEGYTALHLAAHQGHLKIVHFLLTQARATCDLRDNDGDTALAFAVIAKEVDVIGFFASSYAQLLNTQNNKGRTPLHISANKQHAVGVALLLNHGANPNLQDDIGDTALHDALIHPDKQIIDLLIGATNMSIRNKAGRNCLHQAAIKGNPYGIRKIIEKDPLLTDTSQEDGFSSLHIAAVNDHVECINVLVKQGHAQVDSRNKNKWTPLMLAVFERRMESLVLLLKLGADIHAADSDGDTSLHLLMHSKAVTRAQMQGFMEGIAGKQVELPETSTKRHVARYLMEHGASILRTNKKGKTPLDLTDDSSMKELLIEARVDYDCEQKHLQTNQEKTKKSTTCTII